MGCSGKAGDLLTALHVHVCLAALQRIKDWAVKMRKPEVPYSTIEECARHADIIGVSALHHADWQYATGQYCLRNTAESRQPLTELMGGAESAEVLSNG